MLRTLMLAAMLMVPVAAFACCIEGTDLSGTACNQPCHPANATCGGCSRCPPHCYTVTSQNGDRCSCGWLRYQSDCYNSACPNYRGTGAPPPGGGAPPPPEAVPGNVKTACEAAGLPPEECAGQAPANGVVQGLPPPTQDALKLRVLGGPAPAPPASTLAPGVELNVVVSSSQKAGIHLLIVDETGRPLAGVPVAVQVDGGSSFSGVSAANGWYRSPLLDSDREKTISITLGPPVSSAIRNLKNLVWLVVKAPRR
jgi:hypothetical protein